MKYTFSVDLHSHSNKSYDSNMDAFKLVSLAKKVGLNGIAITDHNYFSNERIKKLQKQFPGFLVVPAEEIRTNKGDIIAIGLNEEIPGNLSLEETQDEIKKQNAVLIVPHCYEPIRHGISENVERLKKPFLMETINAKSIGFANKKAMKYALKNNLSQTGGSDAHLYSLIGDAYTLTEYYETVDDFVEGLKKGKCIPGGQKSNLFFKTFEILQSQYYRIKRGGIENYPKKIKLQTP